MGRSGAAARPATAPVVGPRRQVLTPAELADGFDLLGHVIDGDALEEERAIAREVLRDIRGLLRDVRSGADDVLIGRQASLIKPSVTLMKLQVLAPKGALDGMVRWVEAQAGSRGRRELTPISMITDDGTWTELELPTKAQDAGFQTFRRELTTPTP